MKPDVLLLGQITVDDTVPAEPGPWDRQLGGNALYSLAGAKLWCAPERLGVVARVPKELPFDIFGLLESHGLSTDGLLRCDVEPLVEWILYEDDGNRQSLPRNPLLRDPGADATLLQERYLALLTAISASVDNIPAHWLPAAGVHLAPQVPARHGETAKYLQAKAEFVSVDPSPHYSRGASATALRSLLPGVVAFLPSQAEVEHMGAKHGDWVSVVAELHQGGFPEVVLKRGASGCLLLLSGVKETIVCDAAPAKPRDLTGAGDAFSGAYMANRAQGLSALEAVYRACVAAAMVIECSGTEAALALSKTEAQRRLAAYKQQIAPGPSVIG